MEQIASFKIDHNTLTEGIYVSRIDSDITTYDLRTRRPNKDDYMDNCTMHSVEHMLATVLRSGELKNDILYFGPMGCQTGFYLLVRNADNKKVLEVLTAALKTVIYDCTTMFGASAIECGNYKNLNLQSAKEECKRYLNILQNKENTFNY
ncbi:MAG: S-ribosylhomocysteine lyase [Clostridia bacterium]|nr:S-ribosylhomocysteine lyase [Clostridia bacterium]